MTVQTATASPVEFIGFVAPHEASETRPLQGPDYLVRVASAPEDGGFVDVAPLWERDFDYRSA